MNYKKSVSLIFAIVVLLVIGGCAATVQMMSDEDDLTAKKFSPKPLKANLYIFRTSYFGYKVLYKVYLDGKVVGIIAPGTYILYELEPKEYHISVITEESVDGTTKYLHNGQNYFIELVPKTGQWHARAKLRELNPEEGKKAVMGAKRAAPFMEY